jgi:hypothetical protein
MRHEIEKIVERGDVSIYSMLDGIEREFMRQIPGRESENVNTKLPDDAYIDEDGNWAQRDIHFPPTVIRPATENEKVFVDSLQSVRSCFFRIRLENGYEPPDLY